MTWFCALDVIEVLDILDQSEAVRIGLGRAKVPAAWLELLTDDERERHLWREREWSEEAGE